MDYTPIDARRVLFAVSLTLVIALTPVAFCMVLNVGPVNPATLVGTDASEVYRGLVLAVESVILAAAVAGIGMAAVRLGQRMMRRPQRT